MRGFWKLTLIQSKLFLREPAAFFFTLVFPGLVLLLFGAIFGGASSSAFVDAAVPAYVGVMIASQALMGIPVETAFAREHGILRRYRATPLHPLGYISAHIAVNLGMSLLGATILVLTGKLIYHLHSPESWLTVLLAFALTALALFASGYVLASVAATGRVAQGLGQVVFFPMMFLSGAYIPLEVMPQRIRQLSQALPLTQIVLLLRGLWAGDRWAAHTGQLAMVLGVLLLGTLGAVKAFRWE